jgi:hypothetical protein
MVDSSLPGAAALARGLLILARSGRSGALTIHASRATAKVGVRDGRVVAMRIDPDDGDSLGAALRRMGAWDEERAKRAGAPPLGTPVGTWGIAVGATSAAAVSCALRQQLRRRIDRLFALEPHELSLSSGSCDVGVPQIAEPPTSAELIVSALRERVQDEPLLTVRRRLGDGMLVLTPIGKELLASAVLWPEEQAMVPLLTAGASVDAVVAATSGSPRAQRTLYALRMIGACGPPEPREGYAVLLRKKRQLERGARPAELLEVAPGSRGPNTRRALRRLASVVHPDRYGDAPDAIRAASHEVMTAIVRAQRDLG